MFANQVILHIPDHREYIEPYFGPNSILLLKKPAKVETVNDIDSIIMNFFCGLLGNHPKIIKPEYHWFPVIERLKQVQIEHKPPIEVIKQYTTETSLCYCDGCGLTEEEQEELIGILLQTPGKIMLLVPNGQDEKLDKWKKVNIEDIYLYLNYNHENVKYQQVGLF